MECINGNTNAKMKCMIKKLVIILDSSTQGCVWQDDRQFLYQ